MSSSRPPRPVPGTRPAASVQPTGRRVRDVVRHADQLYRGGWLLYSGLVLLVLLPTGALVTAVQRAVENHLRSGIDPVSTTEAYLASNLAVQLILWPALVLLSMSLQQMTDGQLRRGKARLSDAVPQWSRLPAYAVASVASGFGFFLGVSLCFVGIVGTSAPITHAPSLVVTGQASLRDAWSMSVSAFREDSGLHVRWEFAQLLLVLLAWLFPCGLGFIVVFPLLRIGQVVACRRFLQLPETEVTDVTEVFE